MSTIISNKKNMFIACGISAALIVLTACNNDADTKSAAAKADSASTAMTDITASAKPVVKVKKGKASAMMAADKSSKIEKGKDGIYITAEKMPQYPGGDAALSKYVEDNINYPQDALDNSKEGTVKVSFVVNENGKVTMPKVDGAGVSSSVDNEAERIVKQMPAWTPGMVKGKPVKTRLELPITFKINPES